MYPKCLPILFDYIRPREKNLSPSDFVEYYNALEELFKVNQNHHLPRISTSKMLSQIDFAESFVMDMLNPLKDNNLPPMHVAAIYLKIHSPESDIRISYKDTKRNIFLHAPPHQAELKSKDLHIKVNNDVMNRLAFSIAAPDKNLRILEPFQASPDEVDGSIMPNEIEFLWDKEFQIDEGWELINLKHFLPEFPRISKYSFEPHPKKDIKPPTSFKDIEQAMLNQEHQKVNEVPMSQTLDDFIKDSNSENQNIRLNPIFLDFDEEMVDVNTEESADENNIKLDSDDEIGDDETVGSVNFEEDNDNDDFDIDLEPSFESSDTQFLPQSTQEKLSVLSMLLNISNPEQRLKEIALSTELFSVSSYNPDMFTMNSCDTPNTSWTDIKQESVEKKTPSTYCDLVHCSQPRDGNIPGYCNTHAKQDREAQLYRTMVQSRTFFDPYVMGQVIEDFYPLVYMYTDASFERMTVITADMKRMAQSAIPLVEIGSIHRSLKRQTGHHHIIFAVGNTPEQNITILGYCISTSLDLRTYLEFFAELSLAYGELFQDRKFAFISSYDPTISVALNCVFPQRKHCISLHSIANLISKDDTNSKENEFIGVITQPNLTSFREHCQSLFPKYSSTLIESPGCWTLGMSTVARFGRNNSTNISVISKLLDPYITSARLPLTINNLQSTIVDQQKRKIEEGHFIKFKNDTKYFASAASRLLAHATLFIDLFDVIHIEGSTKYYVRAKANSPLVLLKHNTSAIPMLLDALYFDKGCPGPIRRKRVQTTQTHDSYKVDLETRSCSCSFYQDLQLPCIHALACIIKFHDGKVSSFCNEIYHLDNYKNTLDSCELLNLNPTVADLQYINICLTKLKLHQLSPVSDPNSSAYNSSNNGNQIRYYNTDVFNTYYPNSTNPEFRPTTNTLNDYYYIHQYLDNPET